MSNSFVMTVHLTYPLKSATLFELYFSGAFQQLLSHVPIGIFQYSNRKGY